MSEAPFDPTTAHGAASIPARTALSRIGAALTHLASLATHALGAIAAARMASGRRGV